MTSKAAARTNLPSDLVELAELRRLGLVCEHAGRLSLTERGILFADEVFLRFVGR